VDQSIELFIQRAAQYEYRLGYRVEGKAFVELEDRYQIPGLDTGLGAAVGLFVIWDERSGTADGRILFDELDFVANPGFAAIPVAVDAGPDRFSYPGEVVYTNGTGTTGIVESFAWDFGDAAKPNDRAGEAVGAHVYDQVGVYTAALTVQYEGGETATDTATVTIAEKPAVTTLPLRGFLLGGNNNIPLFNDIANWDRQFTWMEEEGYNMGVHLHFHPYPYFIRIPGYPEANSSVSDAELATRRANFETVIRMAESRGIETWFLVYNIHVSPDFAAFHGIPESGDSFDDRGMDSELVRGYTTAAITAFTAEFPQVRMNVTIGESPISPVEFNDAAVFNALRQMNPPRATIIRDQMVLPFEIERLATGLPAPWHVMSKITEEQFLEGRGYRGRLFQEALGKPTFYLQSRTSDGMFFGSYRIAQEQIRAIADSGGAGILVAADASIEWMLREAYGRYMNDPLLVGSGEETFWQGRIAERYGMGVPAADFLEAGEHSTRILPLVRSQLFYRNWNYRTQWGIPLISFLGMPTVTSYQHGNAHRLAEEEAFSWWYPREARNRRDLLTVREYVDESYVSRGEAWTTPPQIAGELASHAAQTLALIPALRSFNPSNNASAYRNEVNMMEAAAHLGNFYASKLRAAMAWHRYASGKQTADEARPEILTGLADSHRHFRKARLLTELVYGAGHPRSTFRMAADAVQPPWPSIDQNYRGTITGGMVEVEKVLCREIGVIEQYLADGIKTLPIFEDMQAGALPGCPDVLEDWTIR